MTLPLGYKYLWIDSLCILQDSVDGWQEQSSVMGSIYQHGICNISATGSKDGKGGLFQRMSTHDASKSPCFIQSTWEDTVNGLWHVYPKVRSPRDFLDGPLLRRGWAVQERVMVSVNLSCKVPLDSPLACHSIESPELCV
jgi:hypothetical protein